METLQRPAPVERLGPVELGEAVGRFREVLGAHQEWLNRLNVYPVPDGDTGTNMMLTIDAVLGEMPPLSGAEGEAPDMQAVCQAISHGSLMGARGNSGVILSQVLRGAASVITGASTVGPQELAACLESASQAAYAAVVKPVEGTILTVVREVAGAARASAGSGGRLADVLEAARQVGADALERTKELLPALALAGVVDAGGAGFLLLIDALLNVVTGRPLPVAPEVGAAPGTDQLPAGTPGGQAPELGPRGSAGEAGGSAGEAGGSAGEAGGLAELRYEVMFLLDAADDRLPGFRQAWAGVGESIVVVGGDGLWNCHIHTDDIGAAIEAAIDVGRPRNIRVTDLIEQVDEERWVREAAQGPGGDEAGAEGAVTGVVAVALGEGTKLIFRSLGVHRVVAGGQTMNPSTAELLDAVSSLSCDEVVLLPNNENIIAVARQAAASAGKPVQVVPTTGIAQGFAALMEYDPQDSSEANANTMARAAERVVTGEVTKAARDGHTEAGPVRAGEWMGLSARGVEHVAAGCAEAAIGLLDVIVKPGHEIVTVIEGEGSSAAATRRITEWVADNREGTGVEVHHGGQPIYAYLFGVE
ncbi:MAG: DAK2 domain-containing protein [Acidimicrobiales bacterium]